MSHRQSLWSGSTSYDISKPRSTWSTMITSDDAREIRVRAAPAVLPIRIGA
ncbi:hypothetical protein ACFQ3F_24970 [Nocardioides ginsengisoli]|uniref:Uncharacterized protein n=1 Tax=Nocardioides ginsengisoli TaxID=363868 RepID=A0ABW3W6Y6_9ACTN